MSRRTVDPRLNASLIREGRMIFRQLQEVFGNREPRRTSYNDVLIAQAEAKAAAKGAALKCSVCLAGDSTTVRDAVTIANGNAVCVTHFVKA